MSAMSSVQGHELQRFIMLREGIKEVAFRAFQIKLLALNATLLAKRFGEQARGFVVISTELRDFSQLLRTQMEGLGENSTKLVSLASYELKLLRQLNLLTSAGQHTAHERLQGAQGQLQTQHQQLQRQMGQIHSAMQTWVDDAYQACLFGTVIARTAKIEAAHAGPLGAALADASNQFSEYVEQILPNLEQLKQALKG